MAHTVAKVVLAGCLVITLIFCVFSLMALINLIIAFSFIKA